MTWRNDPATRAASFHTEPKTWPAFFTEYRAYFDDAPLAPVFGLRGGERLAFLRFRRCPHPSGGPRPGEPGSLVDISVNVAPAARGLGLGTAFIALATRHALVALPELSAVLAEIKPGNAASVRAFLAAGYQRIADGVHEVNGALVPVERYLFTQPPGRPPAQPSEQ